MSSPGSVQRSSMSSPLGKIQVIAKDGRLWALEFGADWRSLLASLADHGAPIAADRVEMARKISGITDALESYFAGKIAALDPIPVDFFGTDFQCRVWNELRRIPAGKTISYADLARRIRHPKAVRAVGTANGANRIPIVVPCHRVITSGGGLGGYAGGLPRKEWLLRHEGVAGVGRPKLRP